MRVDPQATARAHGAKMSAMPWFAVAVDDPCAVALVNVPPATIQEPTCAIANTMPPSIFGVKLAGTELTTWLCWTDSWALA